MSELVPAATPGGILQYLRGSEAAEILGCTKRHISRLVNEGDPPPLPSIRCPDGPRIAIADLLAYAREHKLTVASIARPGTRTLRLVEVAGVLGTSLDYVKARIRGGELQAMKLPGRGDRRVRWTDLVAFARGAGLPVAMLDAAAARHVLIVGAGPVWSEHVRRGLAHDDGWRVVVAFDLLHAGIVTGTVYPEAVIFDTSLPGVDHAYLVGRWREFGCRLAIALAQEDEERPQLLLKAGFDVVLRKPVDHAAAIAAVRERLALGACA